MVLVNNPITACVLYALDLADVYKRQAVTGTSSGRVYQDVVLKPDTSYTLSAYVKTTGRCV